MTMGSKRIRTAPKPILGNIEYPTCPEHDQSMYLDRSVSKWKCNYEGCKVVARRKDDVRQTPKANKAILSLEIVVTNNEEEEKYFLVGTSEGNRTTLDVTDYVDMVIDEHTNSVTLCLLFNSVKRNH